MYSSTLPTSLARYMGWVVNATPQPFYPRERPGTHCGWAPGPVWTVAESLAPPPGFDPRTVQPLASRLSELTTGKKNISKYLVKYQLQTVKGIRKGNLLINPEFLERKGGRYCPTSCSNEKHKRLLIDYKIEWPDVGGHLATSLDGRTCRLNISRLPKS